MPASAARTTPTGGAPARGLVYRTAVASLAVQLCIAVVTAVAYAIPVADARTRRDLNAILGLELASQVIEFAWYAIAVTRMRQIRAWARYLDWVLSTPAMLVSTALFFYHRAARPIGEVFQAPALYACLACNWGMLACGFAGERGWVPTFAALAAGGVAFVASFTLLASLLPPDGDDIATGLFVAMYAVWACYGVAAAFAATPKNVAYNGLDLVSKNFYGIFLVCKICPTDRRFFSYFCSAINP